MLWEISTAPLSKTEHARHAHARTHYVFLTINCLDNSRVTVIRVPHQQRSATDVTAGTIHYLLHPRRSLRVGWLDNEAENRLRTPLSRSPENAIDPHPKHKLEHFTTTTTTHTFSANIKIRITYLTWISSHVYRWKMYWVPRLNLFGWRFCFSLLQNLFIFSPIIFSCVSVKVVTVAVNFGLVVSKSSALASLTSIYR